MKINIITNTFFVDPRIDLKTKNKPKFTLNKEGEWTFSTDKAVFKQSEDHYLIRVKCEVFLCLRDTKRPWRLHVYLPTKHWKSINVSIYSVNKDIEEVINNDPELNGICEFDYVDQETLMRTDYYFYEQKREDLKQVVEQRLNSTLH